MATEMVDIRAQESRCIQDLNGTAVDESRKGQSREQAPSPLGQLKNTEAL